MILLQEALEKTESDMWELLLLERDLTFPNTDPLERMTMLVRYNDLSKRLFGTVRADRQLGILENDKT